MLHFTTFHYFRARCYCCLFCCYIFTHVARYGFTLPHCWSVAVVLLLPVTLLDVRCSFTFTLLRFVVHVAFTFSSRCLLRVYTRCMFDYRYC